MHRRVRTALGSLALAVGTMIASVAVGSPASAATTTSGLWEFNEVAGSHTAWDSSGRGNNGRVGSDITLSCVELAGAVGYSETELLEKWSRDSKILDIFEGTQQIQQLIVARRVLGLTSAELK